MSKKYPKSVTETGTVLVIKKHEKVGGSDNWNPKMNKMIGRIVKVQNWYPMQDNSREPMIRVFYDGESWTLRRSSWLPVYRDKEISNNILKLCRS